MLWRAIRDSRKEWVIKIERELRELEDDISVRVAIRVKHHVCWARYKDAKIYNIGLRPYLPEACGYLDHQQDRQHTEVHKLPTTSQIRR